LSEREPQFQSVKPHAGGTRPPLGSGGPSRSESAAAAIFPDLEACGCAYVLSLWRDDYVNGKLNLSEFEAKVEGTLRQHRLTPPLPSE
jgi:hypothetical protein